IGHLQRGDSLQYCSSNNPLPITTVGQPVQTLPSYLWPPTTRSGNERFRGAQQPTENAGTSWCRYYVHGIWQYVASVHIGPISFSCIALHRCRKCR
ncbi:unnamed protein product, partial [Ixodes hexagonus]